MDEIVTAGQGPADRTLGIKIFLWGALVGVSTGTVAILCFISKYVEVELGPCSIVITILGNVLFIPFILLGPNWIFTRFPVRLIIVAASEILYWAFATVTLWAYTIIQWAYTKLPAGLRLKLMWVKVKLAGIITWVIKLMGLVPNLVNALILWLGVDFDVPFLVLLIENTLGTVYTILTTVLVYSGRRITASFFCLIFYVGVFRYFNRPPTDLGVYNALIYLSFMTMYNTAEIHHSIGRTIGIIGCAALALLLTALLPIMIHKFRKPVDYFRGARANAAANV